VTISSPPNNDGCDAASWRDLLIERRSFDTGDDYVEFEIPSGIMNGNRNSD